MTSPTPVPRRRHRRAATVMLVTTWLAGALAGCASGSPDTATTSSTATGASATASTGADGGATSSTTESITVTNATGSTATITVTPTSTPRPRTPMEGYGEVTITVTTAEGETRTWCLLLADSESLRQQGLMFVDDPGLGGYDGMLFTFDGDTSGGFWMKNTLLPLSIAFLRADGSTTSTSDMEPCPASASNCPTYPANGSYRQAIEVPKGQLGRLGISDRSKVSVGARSCPA